MDGSGLVSFNLERFSSSCFIDNLQCFIGRAW